MVNLLASANSSDIDGYVDGVKNGRLEGWAYRKSDTEEKVRLTLYVNDRQCGIFEANIYRHDLKEAQIGDGRHAFVVPLPRWCQNGRSHTFSIMCTDTDQHVNGSPLRTLVEPHVPTNLQGYLDAVTDKEILGWVLDQDYPEEPLQVELLEEDTVISSVMADRYREDLRDAGIGNGYSAFRFSTPQKLLDSEEHKLSVRVAGTGFTIPPGTVNLKAVSNRPFRGFEEYLRWAVFHPELYPPYSEQDKCIIAEMMWHAEFYHRNYTKRDDADLVSIIMPAWNRAGVIRDAINSILSQDYANWELIVVDDCSKDNTVAVVESYRDERIRLIKCEENGGPGVARSIGMKQAKGKYFAYLDSDNTWDSRYLKILVNYLKDHSHTHSAYCGQIVRDIFHSGGKQAENRFIRYAPFHRPTLENTNYIDLNCFVHDREIYEKEGGFRSELRMFEDWDLILRYTSEHFPVSIPCLLSNYYYGKASNQVTFSDKYNDAMEKIDSLLQKRRLDLQLPQEDSPSESAAREARNKQPVLFGLTSGVRPYQKAHFVSIIIPSYEAGLYLDLCLQSLERYTPAKNYEIIIVDNASVHEALGVIRKYEHKPNITVIHNTYNMGYTYAINQGIKAARKNSDIILFNNDALVTPGWLEALWEVRSYVPEAGLIVPRQTLVPGTDTMDTHVPICNPNREVDVNISRHHYNVLNPLFDIERGFMELSYAAFFCVYVTREVINDVGLLDEKNGRHYRSDNLYSDMVRHITGKKMIYTPHSKLYHFLQRATTELKGKDKKMYEVMFVKNNWSDRKTADELFL